jgi:hypothetical protein
VLAEAFSVTFEYVMVPTTTAHLRGESRLAVVWLGSCFSVAASACHPLYTALRIPPEGPNMRTIVLAFLLCASMVAAENPFVGTWTMNKSKSKPDPNGPQLDSLIVQFSQDGPTLTAIITNDGIVAPPVPIDGKEQRAPANMPSVAGSTHHVSTLKGNTIHTLFKKDGKTVATRNVSVSPDGKTMTSVMEGTLPNGQKLKSVAIFDKK